MGGDQQAIPALQHLQTQRRPLSGDQCGIALAREVEEVLMRHPEVAQAAVIGRVETADAAPLVVDVAS